MSDFLCQKIDYLIQLVDDVSLQQLTLNPFCNGDQFSIDYTLNKSKIKLLCMGYIASLACNVNINLSDIEHLVSKYVGLHLNFNSNECIVNCKGHNTMNAGPQANPLRCSHWGQCLFFNNPVNASCCKNKNFQFEIELLKSECQKYVSSNTYSVGIGLIGISKKSKLSIEEFKKLYQDIDFNEECICDGAYGCWESGELRDVLDNKLFLKRLQKNGYFDQAMAGNSSFKLHSDAYQHVTKLIRIYCLTSTHYISEETDSDSDTDSDNDSDEDDRDNDKENESKCKIGDDDKEILNSTSTSNCNVPSIDKVVRFIDHYTCGFDIDMSCLPYTISGRRDSDNTKIWNDEFCLKWLNSDRLSMIVDNQLNRISFYKNNHHLIGENIDLMDRDKPEYDDPVDFVNGYSNLDENFLYCPVLQSNGCQCVSHGGFTYKVKMKQLIQM